MSIVGIGGAGIPLPYPSALAGYQSFSGTNEVSLTGGQVLVLPPGTFWVVPGLVTFLQFLDPVSNLWLNSSSPAGVGRYVNSDGANWRLANLTGCPVGSIVTNSGTGYTSAPTVTASAGGSSWTAIVGGAISTTVTVGTAGSGYTYAPSVSFSAPPPGGIQATGYATISAGAVNSVVVVNQGAGYTAAPTVTFTPQPFDASTSIVSAAATTALVASGSAGGAQTISAVVCTNPGTPQTSLITLSFSGGGGSSAAATVVGCFAANPTNDLVTISGNGVAYVSGNIYAVRTTGGFQTATATVLNPAIGNRFFLPREGFLGNITTSTTTFASPTLQTPVVDPGLYQTATLNLYAAGAGIPTTLATFTTTVGARPDTSYIQPI